MKLLRRYRLLLWVLAVCAVAALGIVPSSPWLTTFGDQVLIPAAFWLGVVFIVFYTGLSRWWHNPMGRMLVGFDFAFMLIVVAPTLQVEFGIKFDSAVELRFVFLALLIAPIVILSRIILLGRLHRWKFEWPWRHGRDAG